MVQVSAPSSALAVALMLTQCVIGQTPAYKNAKLSPSERATDLLSRMTWEEKVGQMAGIRRAFNSVNGKPDFNRTSFEAIRRTQNGQIGYGAQSNWALDALPMMNELRQAQINSSRLNIPYITIADSVNSIWISGGTLFPASGAIGSSWNVPLYEKVVEAIRDENLALGINWVLSPEVDLARDPRNGRNGEMYGEDAHHVGEFATAAIKVLQEKDENGWVKVATTIKHFVFGQSSGGVNRASMPGGMHHILNDLSPPYRKAIKEVQPMSLMVSYSTVDQIPMSINKHLLQDVLRGILGFKGMLMSDAKALTNLFTESKVASSRLDAALKSLRAGMQHELHPGGQASFIELFNLNGSDRTAAQPFVDAAVTSFLEIKFATGMFERPLPSVTAANATLRSATHLDLNREISRESIVLLKNDGFLPLSSCGRNSSGMIAIVGPYADIINAGNYAPNDPADPRYGLSMRRSLEKHFGAGNVTFAQGTHSILPQPAGQTGNAERDATAIAAAVKAVQGAKMAVVVLGSGYGNFETKYAQNERSDTEGYSHPDLGFPGAQQQLLNAVLETGVPTVLVMSSGQTFVVSNSTLSRCRAVLHTWWGGEFTGDALTEILAGKTNPSGKLAVSMPQANGAFPMAYDYFPSDAVGGFQNATKFDWHLPGLKRKSPLPFGFGLSYTKFKMTGGAVTVAGGKVTVSVTVANTGKRDGKEVVQVYYRPEFSTIEFPVMKLIRFSKVALAAGESKQVTLEFAVEELGYYVGSEWTVEKGKYEFWVGGSSRAEDLVKLDATIS